MFRKPAIVGQTDVSIPDSAPAIGGTSPSVWDGRRFPEEVRKLFRSTVTVADEDPPGMEFRLLIQRPFQTEGSVFFTTSSKPLATMELRKERARYVKWEPNTRLWMEQRQVSDWREVEE